MRPSNRRAFAALIRAARKADSRGWSQEELADRLEVGRSTVARWESGEGGPPKLESLLTLVHELGIPGDDVARAVGLIPDEQGPASFEDRDEQAIWELGTRRGWDEDVRWGLIDAWRLQKMREARQESSMQAASTRSPEELLEIMREADERADRTAALVVRYDDEGEEIIRRASGD